VAFPVEYTVEEAMDLSYMLRYDDNKYATGLKAEKQ